MQRILCRPFFPEIIGWHPTEAGSYTPAIEKTLQEQLTLPKVVTLGEIGLDCVANAEQAKLRRGGGVVKHQVEALNGGHGSSDPGSSVLAWD